MQLSLFNYVLSPEESTLPSHISAAPEVFVAKATSPLSVGQQIKITRVSTLPVSLGGQLGAIESFIAADIVQVRTDSGVWTIETSQVEPLDGAVTNYGTKAEKSQSKPLFPEPPFEVIAFVKSVRAETGIDDLAEISKLPSARLYIEKMNQAAYLRLESDSFFGRWLECERVRLDCLTCAMQFHRVDTIPVEWEALAPCR